MTTFCITKQSTTFMDSHPTPFLPFFKSSLPNPPKCIVLVFDPDLTHFPTSSPPPLLFARPSPPHLPPPPANSSMDLSDLHHIFQMFDHNGDGKITIQELSKSLESLGIHIPDADLEHMIDHIDMDGDGMVNMDEFTGLYKMILMEEERDEEEDIREAFNVFDKNGDGFISVEELQAVMMSLGLRQGRTIEDCQLMVNKVDVDGDGRVDYKEFRQMMKGGGFAAL